MQGNKNLQILFRWMLRFILTRNPARISRLPALFRTLKTDVGIDYDLSCLKNRLSARDIDVLKLHIRGYSATEIGKVFGLTRSWASATIKKAQTVARRKFCYT